MMQQGASVEADSLGPSLLGRPGFGGLGCPEASPPWRVLHSHPVPIQGALSEALKSNICPKMAPSSPATASASSGTRHSSRGPWEPGSLGVSEDVHFSARLGIAAKRDQPLDPSPKSVCPVDLQCHCWRHRSLGPSPGPTQLALESLRTCILTSSWGPCSEKDWTRTHEGFTVG